MQVVILIAFVVALTLAEQEPLLADDRLLLPAVVAYLAAAVAMGAFRTAMSLRALGQDGELPARALRRHNVLGLLTQLWLVGGLAGVMLLGYGQWALVALDLRYVPLAGEIVILAPFVVALLLHWLLEYPFYRAVRRRIALRRARMGQTGRTGWTLGEYLGYNLRHSLLFVAVPVGLILLVSDALWLVAQRLSPHRGDIVATAGSMAWAGFVFLIAPLLIVHVWRTVRLPEGDLRRDLVATCRRMRLKYRELLIWQSGGMIANAGVMGLIGKVRYVLLSDALLEQMDEPQIKAVFGHEAGHILSHHLFYSMLFAVSAGVLCSVAGTLLARVLDLPSWGFEVSTLGLLGLAWALGFGWLSRRFERQSDVIGAWVSAPDGPRADGRITPEGAAIFARALERVARLNGMPTHQWNWRHGSIAARVRYILYLGSTAGNRSQIDRVVRRIKRVLWAAAAAAVAAVVLWAVWVGAQGEP